MTQPHSEPDHDEYPVRKISGLWALALWASLVAVCVIVWYALGDVFL
ncbi:MAG TPA: hypothetical protein VGB97_03865 [Candidatus Paceibacterota bacterium]|jgi:hypothetical protein